MLSPRETYALFIGIRNHFTIPGYDYFKYGPSKVLQTSFNEKKDVFVYENLAKKYPASELEEFFVANVLENPKIWSTSLLTDTASDIFRKHQKYIQALTYNVEQELQALLEEDPDVKSWFKGTFPSLITYYLQHTISLETLIILEHYIQFKKKFDERLADDFLWPDISKKMEKYSPFLKFDHKKMKEILLNTLPITK